jgi:hypothetical protein
MLPDENSREMYGSDPEPGCPVYSGPNLRKLTIDKKVSIAREADERAKALR